MTTPEQIRDAVMPLLRLLVIHPDRMVVELLPDTDSFMLRVNVDQKDVGRLVGKQGRTARSLRVLVAAIGHQAGVKMRVDLLGIS